MAARRLVAVLIVLLVLSTVAAVLLPAPRRPIGETGSTPTTTTTTTERRHHWRPEPPAGDVVRATLSTSSHRVVRARVGDELRLRVTAERPDQVELRGFGLVQSVDGNTPALFDAFAERPGDFPVRLLAEGATVGRIVVVPRGHGRETGASCVAPCRPGRGTPDGSADRPSRARAARTSR